ncbi:MAG: hypothetical protein ABJG68_11820 [Crocinitomicaceae bacterium]
MHIHVLKTDLNNLQEVNRIAPILDLHPAIKTWTVDTEDIDKVLRLVCTADLQENQIIPLLTQYGVQLQLLNY